MSAIVNNTGGIVVDGTAYSTSTLSFSFVGAVNTSTSSNMAPKAFLNWIVFDRHYAMKDGGFVQISEAAKENGTDIAHGPLLKNDIQIKEPGYVYIYLSNENETPVEVYFDDFTVEHIKSPVVQMDDYYPFGLTFNSYQRENSVSQNHLYQTKELQFALGLDTYDFDARMYDPVVARTWQLDPQSEKYYNWSPYHWVADNPLLIIDPTGENWFYYQAEDEEEKSWHWHEGKKATYTNKNGKERTARSIFEYLVTYEVTGHNAFGAQSGTLKVYGNKGQDDVMLSQSGTFSGSGWWSTGENPLDGGFNAIPAGNYYMNLNSRDKDGPDKMNAGFKS